MRGRKAAAKVDRQELIVTHRTCRCQIGGQTFDLAESPRGYLSPPTLICPPNTARERRQCDTAFQRAANETF